MQTPEDGKTWLTNKINEYNDSKNVNLRIPTDKKGKPLRLRNLNKDQFKVAYMILQKCREWINIKNKTPNEKKKFKPLRMTVLGCAGTGKSILINTVVACIRRIFKNNNSVFVTAPTGAAAHNVCGQTIHREFKVHVRKKHEFTLSQKSRTELMEKLAYTIALFFDERSMISQKVLGSTEINIKKTAHKGGHDDEDWGGIPIVVIFGDDYQLPPPCEDGAIDSFDSQGSTIESKNGSYHFIQLGKTTSELIQNMRQEEKENEMREMLKNVRIGHPNDKDTELIRSLHLNSGKFTLEQISAIENKAMYVFANRKNMKEHNRERLRIQHNAENPIARIRVSSISGSNTSNKIPKCFKKDSDIDPILNICREAKVQLTGKNFEPDWGLFNGAVGTVKEIVYLENESPIDGTMPQYILVEFPEYIGPTWIQNKPKWVPIPTVEIPCSSYCCTVKLIPLTLAYAKTGHTFQGQTVGPQNAIQCIIIQPGTIKMEHLCPGLLYMFMSRGTTIGTSENRSKSAIFFSTDELTKDRIQKLTTNSKGETCRKIVRRSKWIKYLKRNDNRLVISESEKEEMIRWTENTTVSQKVMDELIEDNYWRHCNTTNY